MGCNGTSARCPDVNYFRFSENKGELQSVLELTAPLLIDSTMDIYIIDGNNDGLFTLFYEYGELGNPDRLGVRDILTTQFSGSVLTDSICLLYYDKKYLITIDLDLRIGAIRRVSDFKREPDIALKDEAPASVVYTLEGQDSLAINDIMNGGAKYYLLKNWAPFCRACVSEIPYMEANLSYLESRSVGLRIFVDHAYVDEAMEYFQRSELYSNVYMCDIEALGASLNMRGYPSSVLFDEMGKYFRHYNFMTLEDVVVDLSTRIEWH
jgi:hypothetical protein